MEISVGADVLGRLGAGLNHIVEGLHTVATERRRAEPVNYRSLLKQPNCYQAADLPSYTYVILLTSKDQRTDMIAGLGAGADNSLIKRCGSDELRARVAIAARIVDLERRLRTARGTDRGGEELLILTEARLAAPAAIAERVRAKIASGAPESGVSL